MKVSVWTDILIILVLVRFITGLMTKGYITSIPFIAFVFISMLGFLALRSPFIQAAMRSALSIVAVITFLIDILYSRGSGALLSFLVLLVPLFIIYFIFRRIFPVLK